jgi:signal transduction histidine kinase
MVMSSAPQASLERLRIEAVSARPAWLFASDGSLIWRNFASGYFAARLKKSGPRLAPVAAPLKGQVARALRLGGLGRTSLSRLQFIAGDRPASATCACTPLVWRDGETALLVVGVDPIEPELLASGLAPAPAQLEELPDLDTPDFARFEGEPDAVVPAETDIVDELADQAAVLSDDAASDEEAERHEPLADESPVQADDGDETETPDAEASPGPEAFEDSAPDAVQADTGVDETAPEAADPDMSRLSSLMDRMVADERLFAPIEDDAQPDAADFDAPAGQPEIPAEAPQVSETEARPALYRVIGRYLRPDPEDDSAFALAGMQAADLVRIEPPETFETTQWEPGASVAAEVEPAPLDAAQVERVSRYNFDELARILNDRVGEPTRQEDKEAPPAEPPATSILARQPQRESGALINLGGETLVLNRLPLGILVFRDQSVLFANRAITEMVGFDSVESLRQAGLAAIFPGQDETKAGPVNHLVGRDGTLIPVTARLQSVSWQGRPALMLSASATEVRTGHESAVRAFAESMSGLTGNGFFEANRSGTIVTVNARALDVLGAGESDFVGKPLTSLVSAADRQALRDFLERPARFAETERPVMRAQAAVPGCDVIVFAQGQAGLVSGYFGYVVAGPEAVPPVQLNADAPDAGLLARLSRGLRRPLNTIVGFSDLIASSAFGPIENRRYVEYARDIRQAGEDIAGLVDEIDAYAKLNDGRYLPERASLDLLALLETSIQRIRAQASAKRVILRTALSPNLPRVTADSASLTQAILNLLASAIDQTPVGAAVVVSAQVNDDGGIGVHVRDNSENGTDLSERFVVFRDGPGRNGQELAPARSSVGLALTRSLLAVNAVSLSVDPAGQKGLLFSLLIPADLVERD